MNYNWADPKKNSRLTAILMTKAEATRKKRLTSVRSTLSNQLHPATEQKLRRRKKRPESGQRDASGEWNVHGDTQPGHSNNNAYETRPEEERPVLKLPGAQLKSSSSSGSVSTASTASLEPLRHDVFPAATLSCSNSKAPMFEEFGLHAAADGLFHPASTIEAFIEHDAKYHPEVPRASARSDTSDSGSRRARSGAEYPPSREGHKLPALESGKAKRERLASQSEPTLHFAGSRGSALRSMASGSSASQLLGIGDDGGERSRLAATQSDTSLDAPRRPDLVPSSADRSALDMYEHEAEGDGQDDVPASRSPVAEPATASTQQKQKQKQASGRGGSGDAVPPLDFSLTRKFEELKRVIQSNRERSRQEQQDQAVGAASASSTAPCSQTMTSNVKGDSASRLAAPDPSRKTRKKSSQPTRSAGRTSRSGAWGGTDSAGAPCPAPSMRTTAKRTTKTSGSGSASTSTTLARKAAAGATTPPVRATRDTKVRTGVSLADLKEEHRAALEMLKELGGPVDADYQQQDGDAKAPARNVRTFRSRQPGPPSSSSALSRSSRAAGQHEAAARRVSGASPSLQSQQHVLEPATSSPSSTPSSGRLVAKLRASVSCEREGERDAVPETNSPVETTHSPTPTTGRKREEAEEAEESKGESATDNNELHASFATEDAVPFRHSAAGRMHSSVRLVQNDRPLTDVEEVEDEDEEDEEDEDEDEDKDGSEKKSREDAGASDPPDEPRREGVAGGSKASPATPRSGDRYSDEDFEAEW